MSEEADLLARVMNLLWDNRDAVAGARELLEEYEVFVLDGDE